jgi:hypothetical protein
MRKMKTMSEEGGVDFSLSMAILFPAVPLFFSS